MTAADVKELIEDAARVLPERMPGNEANPYIAERLRSAVATDRERVIEVLKSYLAFRVTREQRQHEDAKPEARIWMALDVAETLSLIELRPEIESLLADVRMGKMFLPVYEQMIEKHSQKLMNNHFLSQARIQQKRLAQLPDGIRPKTPGEAYDYQDAVVQQLLDHYGGSVIGYKIACTNVTAQRQLNVDGPFFGRLLSAFSFESPARLDAGKFFMRVIEAEFGFRMVRDLPPASAPHTQEQVAAAVEGVLPGIEIVDSRFDSWTTVGAPSLIADNACNAAWVHGPVVSDWQRLDLAAHPVRLFVNGNLLREGTGSAVLGHPLNALVWLANSLSSFGIGLRAGQYVTTGVTSEVYMAERGDRITADFGIVGKVELSFD